MCDFTFVFVTLFPNDFIINLQSENIVLFFFSPSVEYSREKEVKGWDNLLFSNILYSTSQNTIQKCYIGSEICAYKH